MALSIRQILKGRKSTYRLVEALKPATVFKAQILSSSSFETGFAVVKTAFEPKNKDALHREHHNYTLPAIASCPYIRTLLDVVGLEGEDTRVESPSMAEEPQCLVFEWMEHDLSTILSDRFRQNSNLPKLIAKSVLSALAVLRSPYRAIHTDVNPNNVLLSGIDGPSPVAKLGDLGNMVKEGYKKYRIQSLPTRAPEVWRGLGCWHSSDVWSLGVTLAHWLSPSNIFGYNDKMVQDLTEAWCIAKIQRLVGPLGPPVENPEYQEEFLVAEALESTTFTPPDTQLETQYIQIGTLRQELEQLSGPKVPPDLIDFINHLLIVDHAKRPAAVEALEHPYLYSHP